MLTLNQGREARALLSHQNTLQRSKWQNPRLAELRIILSWLYHTIIFISWWIDERSSPPCKETNDISRLLQIRGCLATVGHVRDAVPQLHLPIVILLRLPSLGTSSLRRFLLLAGYDFRDDHGDHCCRQPDYGRNDLGVNAANLCPSLLKPVRKINKANLAAEDQTDLWLVASS